MLFNCDADSGVRSLNEEVRSFCEERKILVLVIRDFEEISLSNHKVFHLIGYLLLNKIRVLKKELNSSKQAPRKDDSHGERVFRKQSHI